MFQLSEKAAVANRSGPLSLANDNRYGYCSTVTLGLTSPVFLQRDYLG